MAVLRKFSTSRVVRYGADRLLPHVHIQLRDGRERKAEVGSLKVVGRVHAREIRDELDCWVATHEAWLLEQWRRLNP